MKNIILLSCRNKTFVKKETDGNFCVVNRFVPAGAELLCDNHIITKMIFLRSIFDELDRIRLFLSKNILSRRDNTFVITKKILTMNSVGVIH